MNIKHSRNLHDYCRHFFRKIPKIATLAGIDSDGTDLPRDGIPSPIVFLRPVDAATDARETLAEMARDASSSAR